jgi:hypothetical protein
MLVSKHHDAGASSSLGKLRNEAQRKPELLIDARHKTRKAFVCGMSLGTKDQTVFIVGSLKPLRFNYRWLSASQRQPRAALALVPIGQQHQWKLDGGAEEGFQ